jgi:CBS domain containing-hemolysin-like protein
VAAFRPIHSVLDIFELDRLSRGGDKTAKKALLREKRIGDVYSLQRVAVAVLQVLVILFAEAAFGMAVGIVMTFFVALEYGAIARLRYVKGPSQKIYEKSEKHVLKFIRKHPKIMKLLRSAPVDETTNSLRINSREELQHLVAESGGVLTANEKKLIVNSLSFNDQLIKTVMTPRNEISSVNKSEFLGPLALNDLHKIGFSRLPVIDKDIDHIVGILNIKNMLTLDIKNSMTAEKAMDPKVYYIHENQTMQHALAAFLRTHHPLLVVVNEARETVGLLALEDVIETLIGRKIIDEFESHDNLAIVAARGAKN